MTTLEQEIIEKFRQLKPAEKRRIHTLIEQEIQAEPEPHSITFDYAQWFQDVEALRQQIRTSHANQPIGVDVVGILRDLRDGEDD